MNKTDAHILLETLFDSPVALLDRHPMTYLNVIWSRCFADVPRMKTVEKLEMPPGEPSRECSETASQTMLMASDRLLYLPSYSPCFNPIELLRRHFRSELTCYLTSAEKETFFVFGKPTLHILRINCSLVEALLACLLELQPG